MTDYFYKGVNGRSVGPISKETVQSEIRSGLITELTEMRQDDSDEWFKAHERFLGFPPRSHASFFGFGRAIKEVIRYFLNFLFVIMAIIVAICAFYFWKYSPLFHSSSFSEDEISRVKSSIRDSYKKRGLDIVEVVMLKKDDRELVGYVKAKDGPAEATVNCTAIMDQGGEYFWRCGGKDQ